MTLPVLYSFRRCPYAMRARLALRAAGQRCELREVVLKRKPQEMLAISAKGTVPVLQLADGTVIAESLEIMLWALRQNDPQGWLQVDMAQAKALIQTNDGPFKRHLDRTKYPNRYPDEAGEPHRERACALLGQLEQRLTHSAQLCGEETSLADVALFPFVRQFAHIDMAWFGGTPFSHLRRWLDFHLQSPLFAAVMEKYPEWDPDAPAVYF